MPPPRSRSRLVDEAVEVGAFTRCSALAVARGRGPAIETVQEQ